MKITKVISTVITFVALLGGNLNGQKLCNVDDFFKYEVRRLSFLCNSHESFKNCSDIEKSNSFICATVSPFLLYGVSLGFGEYFVNKEIDKMNENIWIIHYNQAEDIMFIEMTNIYDFGIYYQQNSFMSTHRDGLFGLLIFGIDCMVQRKNNRTIYTPCPNLAIGGGYSVKLLKETFLRISLDVGIKCLWTNLNFTIIF